MKPSPDENLHAAQGREAPEPDEQNRPLPWFVIMLLSAMATWGAYYIVTTPSGQHSQWGDQRTVSALRGKPAPPAGAKVDGGPIYAAKCVACHQASGSGVPGVFPPLAGSEWVIESPARLVQILLHGVSGPIVVKGNTYNGQMPAFGSLSDAELAGISTWLRNQWGNSAAEVSASFVTEQRELTKSRNTPWAGGDELKSLP